jgi:hypothetical protein
LESGPPLYATKYAGRSGTTSDGPTVSGKAGKEFKGSGGVPAAQLGELESRAGGHRRTDQACQQAHVGTRRLKEDFENITATSLIAIQVVLYNYLNHASWPGSVTTSG